MSVEKLPIPPVVVDVVSDVVCPWCFIGKRRLEKALALKPEIPVEVRFHPYFLNPWVPREGISRDEYLTTKFGSPDRYKGIATRVQAAFDVFTLSSRWEGLPVALMEALAIGTPVAATSVGGVAESLVDEDVACLVAQQPNFFGGIEPMRELADAAHAVGAQLVAVVEPTSLAILEREWRLGPEADARELARLKALLGRDGTLADLNRELARQLRAGERDERDAALLAHLDATIADKIAIANPKWR